jgi:hypothetical protein
MRKKLKVRRLSFTLQIICQKQQSCVEVYATCGCFLCKYHTKGSSQQSFSPQERFSATAKLERLFLFQPLFLLIVRETSLRIPLKIIRVLSGLHQLRPHHPQLQLPGLPGKLLLPFLGFALFQEVGDVHLIPHLDERIQLVEQGLLLLLDETGLVADRAVTLTEDVVRHALL